MSLPQGVEMSNDEDNIEEYERFHALKVGLTLSKAYLVYSGASNHMVASRESFITFTLSGGPSSHMGDDSKIPVVDKGSEKIQHENFENGLYAPSPTAKKIVEREEEEAESST